MNKSECGYCYEQLEQYVILSTYFGAAATNMGYGQHPNLYLDKEKNENVVTAIVINKKKHNKTTQLAELLTLLKSKNVSLNRQLDHCTLWVLMKIPSAKLFLRSFRNLFLSNSETNVRQIWTPEFCEHGTHGIHLTGEYILKDPPTGKWVEGKRGEHDFVASFFLTNLWPWRYGSRSKVVIHDIPSLSGEYLYQVRKGLL